MSLQIESKLQSNIISWLKINGVYVIKAKAGPGTPVGCPDIIGLHKNKWIAIEVKSSETAPFQAGQKEAQQRLLKMSPFVYVVYPNNWDEIKAELIEKFF